MIEFKPFVYECETQPPYVIQNLPRYIVSNLEELKKTCTEQLPIRKIALPIEFPLSFGDKVDIAIVMRKFTQQPFYSGLAAPQLGILKRIIVFTMRKEDCKEGRRIKVWLNPSYEKINDETTEEYECCVSVKSKAGLIKRYKNIHYKAYDIKGNFFEGDIAGATSRIIQHEIDHLEGKLFIDYIPEDKLISVKELANRVLNQQSASDENIDTN